MISEKIIEEQIAGLAPGRLATDLRYFASQQPQLLHYLTQEDNGAFTTAEQELLFFAGLVLFRSIAAAHGTLRPVGGDRLAELEEANFRMLQEQEARGFRDRITVFFEQSPEEDLLAFLEDLLLDEEGETVSPEGREPLFVTLKTTLDALLEAAQ